MKNWILFLKDWEPLQQKLENVIYEMGLLLFPITTILQYFGH